MKHFKSFLAVCALAASGIALAAGDFKPKFGGVVQEVNEIQYELVAKADSIAIYVEDHGRALDTKNATAKVTLLTGKEKSEVTLGPAGGNKLEAKGTYDVKAGTKAVAVVTIAGKASTIRFVVP